MPTPVGRTNGMLFLARDPKALILRDFF